MTETPDSNSFMRGLSERLGGAVPDVTMQIPTPPAEVAGAQPATQTYDDPLLQQAFEAQQAAEQAATQPPTEAAATETTEQAEAPATAKEGLDAFLDESPEKQEASPVADEEPPAGVRTKETREAWKKMREGSQRAEKLERELAEMRKQLESAGKITDADPVKKENETLRKRIEELEPEIARVAFRKSKPYQETVAQPMQKIGANAKGIAEFYKIPDDKMVAALQEPDINRQAELLDEIVESMNGLHKNAVYSMANDLRKLYELDERMSEQAATAQKEAEAREAEENNRRITERKAAEMREVSNLKPKLLGVAKVLVKEGETPEAYAERIVSQANAVPFDDHEPATKAYLSAAGILVKDMAPALKTALDKVAALEKKIAAMSSASPRAASGSPAPQGTGATGSDFMSRFGERLRNAGVVGI